MRSRHWIGYRLLLYDFVRVCSSDWPQVELILMEIALIGNVAMKVRFLSIYLFDWLFQSTECFFFAFFPEHEACHTVENPSGTNFNLIFRNVKPSQKKLYLSSYCVEIAVHWIQSKAITTMNYFHLFHSRRISFKTLWRIPISSVFFATSTNPYLYANISNLNYVDYFCDLRGFSHFLRITPSFPHTIHLTVYLLSNWLLSRYSYLRLSADLWQVKQFLCSASKWTKMTKSRFCTCVV